MGAPRLVRRSGRPTASTLAVSPDTSRAADADLVRRFRSLPGLAMVLDPDRFVAALRRAASHVGLGAAHITWLKFSSKQYCQLAYRVDAGGVECMLDVRACRRDDLSSWLERGAEPTEPTPLGAGRFVFEDSAVIVTVFPNDPKLPQVPALLDPERRLPLLQELLPDQADVRYGEVRTLRHWPGRRYTAEFSAPDGTRALLKAYTRAGYARARRIADLFQSSGPLRIARPLGFSDRHRMIAFEWLPGQMLSCRIAPDLDREAVRSTGRALAALHAQPARELVQWTRPDESEYLHSLAREVGFVAPWLAPRANALALRLAERLAQAPAGQAAVHGDFSDSQVLYDGSRAGIVDLDSAVCGDPVDDLGNMLAQLEVRVLGGDLTREQADAAGSALLEGHRLLAEDPPEERIAAYTASGLLRRARFAFRTRRPDWPERTESSLERAEEIFDSRAGRPPVKASTNSGASVLAPTSAHARPSRPSPSPRVSARGSSGRRSRR